MDWTLDDSHNTIKINSISDIEIGLQNLMDERNEFLILAPTEQVNGCNFMQLLRTGTDTLYFEINMYEMSDMNTLYCNECSTEKGLQILISFYAEHTIPADLKEWATGGMEQYYG